MARWIGCRVLKLFTFIPINYIFVNVICNILDNAVKYCKNENIKIQVSTHFQKNHLLISCKDNGIGISEEDQKNFLINFSGFPQVTNMM